MHTWQKLVSMVATLTALMVGIVSPAAAADRTPINGLVYIDSNLNGVWDPGEEGYTGQWQEYWNGDEYVQEYVGATISLHAGDPENAILLESAVANEITAAYAENGQDLCTYQDLTIADGVDEDDDPDLNATPLRPCFGTFGLQTVGEEGTYWTIEVTPPEGYIVTSENPQHRTTGSDNTWVDFGLALEGAGGPMDTSESINTNDPIANTLARAVEAGIITQTQANAILALSAE